MTSLSFICIDHEPNSNINPTFVPMSTSKVSFLVPTLSQCSSDSLFLYKILETGNTQVGEHLSENYELVVFAATKIEFVQLKCHPNEDILIS